MTWFVLLNNLFAQVEKSFMQGLWKYKRIDGQNLLNLTGTILKNTDNIAILLLLGVEERNQPLYTEVKLENRTIYLIQELSNKAFYKRRYLVHPVGVSNLYGNQP